MSPGLAVVISLLITGLLLGFVSLYGIFALFALPTPVLLAAVALRVFHGKHIASIALASVLAWISGILVVRAGDVGSHSNPAGLLYTARDHQRCDTGSQSIAVFHVARRRRPDSPRSVLAARRT